jgi:hypothetical protein
LGLILRFVLAAYLAALAAAPFAHHDLACHLKSSTHCATCHAGTSADPGGSQPGLGSGDFADAGMAVEHTSTVAGSCDVSPSAGRSRPRAAGHQRPVRVAPRLRESHRVVEGVQSRHRRHR